MRKLSLYDENGFLSSDYVDLIESTFIFIIGGRGSGKTYTSLKKALECDTFFIYLRRTLSELEMIANEAFSPFEPLNKDFGWCYKPKKIAKNMYGVYDYSKETERLVGFMVALSSVASIRGFDAGTVKLIIYDEFIPEAHRKKIKNEAEALWNAYETVNRNRELFGEKPVKLIGLSNSNDIANPIFMSLEIVNAVLKLQENCQQRYDDSNRSITVLNLLKSPIMEDKKHTALYKMLDHSVFYDMALNNQFYTELFSRIQSVPLKELTPIARLLEITVCEHKSTDFLYVTPKLFGRCPYFGGTRSEKAKVKRYLNYIWMSYLCNKVVFESKLMELLFIKYFTEND